MDGPIFWAPVPQLRLLFLWPWGREHLPAAVNLWVAAGTLFGFSALPSPR